MIPAITRILQRTFGPRPVVRRKASLKDVISIRLALLDSFEDCLGDAAERLRRRVEQAKNPQELWLLRNDVYQVIAHRHDQKVAAERINRLLPVFKTWLDPRQIGRV
jgi:hypothetical protein